MLAKPFPTKDHLALIHTIKTMPQAHRVVAEINRETFLKKNIQDGGHKKAREIPFSYR